VTGDIKGFSGGGCLNFEVWLLVTRFVRLDEPKGVPNDRGAEGWNCLACSAPTDVITITGTVGRGGTFVAGTHVISDFRSM